MLNKDIPAYQSLFINGKWKQAKEYTSLYSPYSQSVLTNIPVAGLEEAESAIEAAVQAKSKMQQLTAHERSTILSKLAELLQFHREQAAELIAKEAAKPIVTARGEIDRTIQTYKFAAQEANQLYGETLPMDAAPGGEKRLGYTVLKPLGVIGAITPFNFPMNLVAHKVGPAIATGNAIVLKPASQTPLSAYFLAELLEEAGLPAGALNVITGSGRVVGDKIVTDERISMITFTGSPEVGIQIRSRAGLKKTTLELGSNSAVIIDEDTDLEKVVPRCVQGAFAFQGQVCISLQRIYVHENIYETFVEKFVEETEKLVTGNPLQEKTNVSAVISKDDVGRALSWIKEAEQNGATLRTGGTTEGSIVLPTVLTGVDRNQKVSCQEVFAPIVLINAVDSVENAITEVNDSRFGLQAGIYTRDIQKAMQASEKLEVGGVLINDIPTFRVDHMPYGGVKESGTGREGIKYAVEEMTELKLVIINNNF
ncbi:aldehyde dehydrogenase family protein [Salibacterium salarium]|uniref:Aldehyde dehydrogenase family protein n=1 Tax=Salibacterium salarium TaxID=284579 RepID=A0A428N3V0_9BACI|nr:aldehyde dehydrogenase family protein [Salibacterium salarium]RSL33120.1 aldehyde dehydrogenase family protein [Salibacterium salarium]